MNIVYTSQDGFLVTVIPSPEYLETNTIEDCAKLSVPPGTPYLMIDPSKFPKDVDFRDAWDLDGENVIVNFEKAKEVWKSKLRIDRAPLLAALDIQFQRAMETGADTSQIVSEKQRLRDITNQVDAATNLDEIRGVVC